MAINVPLPDMSHWGDFSDILQNLMQNRQKQQEMAGTQAYRQGELANRDKELAQRAKELEETSKYHQALTELKKRELERKGTEETPEQKEERAERLATKKAELAEEKENKKQASKIEENVTPLVKTADLALQAKKIMEENPELTGLHNYIGTKTKLSKNKELYKLKQIFGQLQASIGRYASTRGGIQALKWAEGVKPDILNSNEANMAMLDSILENGASEFELENLRHKNKVKKDLPFGFPGSENKVKKWKVENGALVEVK